jgi:hypothetical protein
VDASVVAQVLVVTVVTARVVVEDPLEVNVVVAAVVSVVTSVLVEVVEAVSPVGSVSDVIV